MPADASDPPLLQPADCRTRCAACYFMSSQFWPVGALDEEIESELY